MGKNLKNTNEKLRYFRNIDTGKTEARQRAVPKKDGTKEPKTYDVKIYDKVYFSEADIKNWEFKGDIFPVGNNRNFTIIHNYILHVWSYYLGKDATFAYIMLRSYDFNEREITTTSKQTIAKLLGIKPQTLTEYMNTLEKYDFGYMFQAEKEKDSMQVGSVFVVRSTVPILSQELYSGLPDEIKKEADRIVSSMKKNSVVRTYDDEVDEIDEVDYRAEKTDKTKSEEVIKPAPPKASESFDSAVELVLNQLKESYSDVPYNTWFKNYLPHSWIEKGTIVIPVPNSFTKDIYIQRYLPQLKQLFELHMKFNDITVIEKSM